MRTAFIWGIGLGFQMWFQLYAVLQTLRHQQKYLITTEHLVGFMKLEQITALEYTENTVRTCNFLSLFSLINIETEE